MLYIWFSIFTSVQKTISNEEIALIAYVAFFVVFIVVVFVMFFLMFQKRKNQLLIERVEQQKVFDEELIKSQQEIQEETFKHLGRELHDNVGQLLALAAMHVKAAAKIVGEDARSKVESASDILKETLTEVRALSKSLNSDMISNAGFDVALANEIERLNKSGFFEAELKLTGNTVSFENKKDETILFRILQEFFSNTLKYAEAEHLTVYLNYIENHLDITVKDDGKGFDMGTAEVGSGLINMKKRAELIDANYHLESTPEQGTALNLSYTFRTA